MKLRTVVGVSCAVMTLSTCLPTVANAKGGGGRIKDAVQQDRSPDTKRDRQATEEKKGKFKDTESSRTKDSWPRFK